MRKEDLLGLESGLVAIENGFDSFYWQRVFREEESTIT